MPTYDYTCGSCRKRFEIFLTYKEYGLKPVTCPHCGSPDVRRRAPRVRVLKSEEARLEQLVDPSALDGLENDPQALGRMMRKMGADMGQDLPAEFNEVVDRLEAGQTPGEITGALPDLDAGSEDPGSSPLDD